MSTPAIPNHFHFIFGLRRQTEPFHLCHYLCIQSCLQVNRPEAVHFHYRHEPYGPYWDRIRPSLTLHRVKPILSPLIAWLRYGWKNRACGRYRYAHQSDFIRLDALLEHGGIYADMDTLFVNPIPDELFRKPFVIGRENSVACRTTGNLEPSLCNAFLMAPPASEFARLWRERMMKEFDGSWSRHSTLLPHRLHRENPELVHVEPARSFYRYMWTREDLRILFDDCDPDFSGVVSFHLWAHLWWDKKRRDFSDFHADLLTEEYVRHAGTTYGLAARRFLPPETFTCRGA